MSDTLSITATDISPAALEVARRNAYKDDVSDRITFLETDLFPHLSILDPFLTDRRQPALYPNRNTSIKSLSMVSEPTLALDGGPDGLALIRRILEKAPCMASAREVAVDGNRSLRRTNGTIVGSRMLFRSQDPFA